MNQDEIIWNVINDKFCSYKVKSVTQKFCRNEYNATGLCTRTSCPLANSRYATVREHEGIMYLYVKTPERAHTPANMWEKIKLSKGFAQALEQIDNELIYWPNAIINRCKQRLTKISQYLVTMRKLKLKNAPKMVGIKKKIERREATRERKAEIAAHLEKSIEKELLERLKNKAYGDAPLNVNEDVWNKILESEKLEAEDEESEEENEEELEREMEMGLEDDDREFVADISDDDEDDLEDFMFEAGSQESDEESDDEPEEQPTSKANNKRKQAPTNSAKDKRKKRGQAKLEIEYEHETETRRH